MTPEEFVAKWSTTTLNERQTYQLHFIDICHLIGHEPPGASGVDARGDTFGFEYGAKKNSGAQGYADVFYEGHFAVEYKGMGKHKTLDDAYRQLLQYRENLNNPPLLVVCDIAHWEIHTNFNNTIPVVHRFTNADLLEPAKRRLVRDLFFAPDRLRPTSDTEQVTKEAATAFQYIVDNMRNEWQADPDRIARFLTKLVFCLFAEDIGLLPQGARGERGIFSEIVEETRTKPDAFARYMGDLFKAMADGGEVLYREIPYFNGSLFDNVQVERLSLKALGELDKACHLDWSSVEPAIFGTLFERSLDPSKRSQLGAHYTSRDDILLIVEPVLMTPLRREWAALQAEAAPVRDAFDTPGITPRVRQNRASELLALRERMLHRLRTVTVLDPACGSGNFLYVALQLLMNMEKEVITHPLWLDLPLAFPEVHPRQLYGIEVNPIAHGLASIVAWIGYIQWREKNGYHAWKPPILEPLQDNIVRMDAVMQYDADGQPFEPQWPQTDVIVGNPPFLGDKKMRASLNDKYVDDIRKLYEGRLPGGTDFVTYWFEKARAMIEAGNAQRAGLLATNSIRGGANRRALERIKQTGDIFMAWSDRNWTLEGAAVRVSMVGFDGRAEIAKMLNGAIVDTINSDLTTSTDVVNFAKNLIENGDIAFIGDTKKGAFDISNDVAAELLNEKNNVNQHDNHAVIVPWINGLDVTLRPRNMWIIDFGTSMSQSEASQYVAPYNYIIKNVKPARDLVRNDLERTKWWLHARPAPDCRRAVAHVQRYIATPTLSKHRLFTWFSHPTLPDHQLVAIARDDDYFFGVLHSRLHEVWSLRMGTSLEDRPRYTPTTTFETFPFPWPPGYEDTSSPAYAAVSAAAKALHEERDAWLNPPGLSAARLQKRTLTNLYNALLAFRGTAERKVRIEPDAGDFAPRLDELHTALDRAVCDAYGWPHDILSDEEAMLTRLLALNLARAGA
jgi:hypothetical protein